MTKLAGICELQQLFIGLAFRYRDQRFYESIVLQREIREMYCCYVTASGVAGIGCSWDRTPKGVQAWGAPISFIAISRYNIFKQKVIEI